MAKTITLCEYRRDDCAEIMRLFYDTIHCVNAADYNKAQLDAWAPREIDIDAWNDRFLRDNAVVAKKDGVIVGIGTLKTPGYFDLPYVHKNYQRIGIATLIADKIEAFFRNNGIAAITTDASITAKPFFEKRGFVVLKKQTVETRGQTLVNYKMEKTLL